MEDNELLCYAKLVYGRFKVTPQWSADGDDLLRRWGAACLEMSRRGMTDTVTEGGPARDAVTLVREAVKPRSPWG